MGSPSPRDRGQAIGAPKMRHPSLLGATMAGEQGAGGAGGAWHAGPREISLGKISPEEPKQKETEEGGKSVDYTRTGKPG